MRTPEDNPECPPRNAIYFLCGSLLLDLTSYAGLAGQPIPGVLSTSPALALQGTPPCPVVCAWGQVTFVRTRVEA